MRCCGEINVGIVRQREVQILSRVRLILPADQLEGHEVHLAQDGSPSDLVSGPRSERIIPSIGPSRAQL